ncbi:hypothetical protein AVEN_93857-1 [Araneus ventricosus]|uniref:Uncharacterized protein n=1 Tax=Araneus ventricosus TaxID=182803 RepID=A0A4Y2B047_ARAVE|nr:hypothetical protein AVEN_93857-1 [Araneus ventricosus]
MPARFFGLASTGLQPTDFLHPTAGEFSFRNKPISERGYETPMYEGKGKDKGHLHHEECCWKMIASAVHVEFLKGATHRVNALGFGKDKEFNNLRIEDILFGLK